MQAKPYICDLAPYQPGMPTELVARTHGLNPADIIKLASNENPLGPSPLALEALREAAENSHRYPEQYALTQALASHLDVAPEALVIGNGSNDILDLIARTYLGDGDDALTSQYAFAMYDIAIRSAGANNIIVAAQDYGHDLSAMRAAITSKTKVIWIANPNNPTGTFLPYSEIKEFLDTLPPEILVVLDEAYYEYLPKTATSKTTTWLQQYPNLILVRTFSKIYGLADLRVGYAVAAPSVANMLNRVRLPFTSNGLAIAAATAALSDIPYLEKSHILNEQGREQLLKGLKELGLTCLPAYGNFVTVCLEDASSIYEQLLARGIIVRPLQAYAMQNWLRVSVGLKSENSRFLDALRLIV
jgi:histidinol-phosphate aminotransferase